MLVKGKAFRERRVRLDGTVFEGCTFERCTMVYSGTKPTAFVGGTIDACNWDFEGPALNVFRFLAMVERTGGRGLVDTIVRKVRESAEDPPHRPH